MRKNLNIAMVGSGFMGRMHSNAYRQANSFFDSGYAACTKVLCARDAARGKEFAERWGWQETETDWRKLLERKDIDLIDIVVPNMLHREIAVAALQAGKMVATEKPLALNAGQGKEMVDAAEKSGKKTMIWFNQRRFPPVALAKQMIEPELSAACFITGLPTSRTGQSARRLRWAGARSGVSTSRTLAAA